MDLLVLVAIPFVALAGYALLLVSFSAFAGLSGWSRLARRYAAGREEGEEPIEWRTLQALRFERLSYGFVSVGIGAAGLHLRCPLPLHAPILVPWQEIARRAQAEPGLTGLWRAFDLGHQGSVSFPQRLADVVEAARAQHAPRASSPAGAVPLPVPRLEPRPASDLRCPACHDALDADATTACPACGTALHTTCLAELGGCTALGCAGRAPRLQA